MRAKRKIDMARLDLGQLAALTTEQMKLLAEEKSIRLTSNVAAEVYADGYRSHLQQVVVNLVINAVKYTQEGGDVELRVFSRSNGAVIEVSDNGPGFLVYAVPQVRTLLSRRQGPFAGVWRRRVGACDCEGDLYRAWRRTERFKPGRARQYFRR